MTTAWPTASILAHGFPSSSAECAWRVAPGARTPFTPGAMLSRPFLVNGLDRGGPRSALRQRYRRNRTRPAATICTVLGAASTWPTAAQPCATIPSNRTPPSIPLFRRIGAGGGIYIASGGTDNIGTAVVDTVDPTVVTNNTDSSGLNGPTANIDGTYILKNC
jgi:hypothetical protein